MKRRALLLLLTFGLALAAPAFAQDVFLLGFTGFDYEDPDPLAGPPDATNYLALGEGYKMVGFITSFGEILDGYYDQSSNEYTVHFFDLFVTSRAYNAGILNVGFTPGRGRYFEDPYTGGGHCSDAQYGVFPPNATAPSTFIDCGLLLGGSINNFVLTYNFNRNQGSFVGQMNLDEGSALVYIPASQRAGWTLGGLAGRPNATVPDGYDNQVEGECRIPDVTPTTHSSWGAIKKLYR